MGFRVSDQGFRRRKRGDRCPANVPEDVTLSRGVAAIHTWITLAIEQRQRECASRGASKHGSPICASRTTKRQCATVRTERILVLVRRRKKVCASSKKRPQISPASTTNLARPLSPDGSGNAKTSRRRPASEATPLSRNHRQRAGVRRECTDCQRGRRGTPGDLPQSLMQRWSCMLMPQKSKSRKKTLGGDSRLLPGDCEPLQTSMGGRPAPNTPAVEQLAR